MIHVYIHTTTMADFHGKSDHSDEEVHGKRHRNEKEWKQNKKKRLRAEGKEYISTSGKNVPARITGNKCR